MDASAPDVRPNRIFQNLWRLLLLACEVYALLVLLLLSYYCVLWCVVYLLDAPVPQDASLATFKVVALLLAAQLNYGAYQYYTRWRKRTATGWSYSALIFAAIATTLTVVVCWWSAPVIGEIVPQAWEANANLLAGWWQRFADGVLHAEILPIQRLP